MFESRIVTVAPVLPNQPVDMPVDVLLALAPGQTSGVPESFNVLAVCNRLLGHFGWTRATRVLNPKVWAPDWDRDRFAGLLLHAGLEPGLAGEIRVDDFPGIDESAGPAPGSPTPYDIVHYVGEVFAEGSEDTPLLVLAAGSGATRLRPGALRDALVACRARLLVLQVGVTRHKALRLAEFVAAGGGPAVLVVTGRHAGRLHDYLVAFYGGIVHNQPLPQIAAPEGGSPDDPEVTLFSSAERDQALLFDGFMDLLGAQLGGAAGEMEARAARLRARSQEKAAYLHRAQAEQLQEQIALLENEAGRARKDEARLGAVRGVVWDHESSGVVPVSEIAERVAALADLRGRYPELEAELESLQARAPRVLNANFADPQARTVLDPYASLVAGEAYDLLVDVGPRWNRVPSLVSGNAEFPEEALPPAEEGFVVKVVVVSSDFSPRVAAGEMWVPRVSGRSYPFVNGRRAGERGPIALRLMAPEVPSDVADGTLTARARLCLFYRNNVLQSAAITVGVSRQARRLDSPGVILVDYAISGTFQEVEERYATRDLRLPGEADSVRHAVAASFTMNDGGAGNHRIIVSGDEAHSPGWIPYDPEGATDILEDARRELLNCFWRRGKGGQAEPEPAVDGRNGKTFEQFRRDLFMLALAGRRLYRAVLIDARAEAEGLDPVEWERDLRRRLDRSRVIQIARTGPAQYAFPWGLMYEYPLGSMRELHTCDVLRQWSDDGTRNGPPALRCPYADDESHRENVVCPYGFWGLKHVIEQPLSALERNRGAPRDATKEISVRGDVRLAAGWTSDAQLDPQRIAAHRQQILAIAGIRFADPQPNPAHDLDAVRAVLVAPALVYFLCHGEYDSVRKEPYLGIGPHDQDVAHRIYPSTIQEWAFTTVSPNLYGWGASRPLVFINGCHTADLQPGQILNFVSAFAMARAGGVIGTEVSVRLPLAAEIAECLLGRLARGERAGRALYDMRWELANRGNLLGLAYTLYAMADLRLVKAA